jgi:hypothetical protein
MRVDSILGKSQSPATQLIALTILEDTIKYRWNTLPDNQQEGIKKFTVRVLAP